MAAVLFIMALLLQFLFSSKAHGRQVPWDAPDLTDEPGGQKGIRNVPVTEQAVMKHKES